MPDRVWGVGLALREPALAWPAHTVKATTDMGMVADMYGGCGISPWWCVVPTATLVGTQCRHNIVTVLCSVCVCV